MKLLLWVLPAVMLLLLILCVTGVAPMALTYTLIPGLAVVAIVLGSRAERR
jgi:hypothetical protein